MRPINRADFTRLTNCVIPVWALLLTFLCASLMVSHWVSLPAPQVGSTLQAISADNDRMVSSRLVTTNSFQVSHFLYVDCPCSRRVLDYLAERSPLATASERIVFICDDDQKALPSTEIGFSVDVVTSRQCLAKYGVESAPLMVVTDKDGRIQYSGGYTNRKQGLDYQDRAIVQRLMLGEKVDSLPVFGCAVSQRLKQIVDPIGMKSN